MPTWVEGYRKLEYASEEEVLEFANSVRKAGGGEALPALLPAKAQDSYSCLIAKALNFHCRIEITDEVFVSGDYQWIMRVDSDELARKIANHCHLRTKRDDDGLTVKLPKRIGNVAAVFDAAFDYAEFNEETGWYDEFPNVWLAKYYAQ